MITTKERIRIQDLVLPELHVYPVHAFDPEKDLKIQDWADLTEDFRNNRSLPGLIISNASWAKTLFPKMPTVTDYQPKFEELAEELLMITHVADKGDGITVNDRQLWYVLGNKILFPEMFDKRRNTIRQKDMLFNFTKNSFIENTDAYAHFNGTVYYRSAIRDYLIISLLFPEKLTEFETIAPSTKLITAEQTQNRIDSYERENQWFAYAQTLGLFRLLKPSEFPKISVSSTAWDNMHQELQEARQNGNIFNFGDQAFWMNIVAADEVKLDDKGLYVADKQPKKAFSEKAQVIPVRRRF